MCFPRADFEVEIMLPIVFRRRLLQASSGIRGLLGPSLKGLQHDNQAGDQ
jgi:hypothetical protein